MTVMRLSSLLQNFPKANWEWHGFPPSKIISLPGNEHPEISCPTRLLAGRVGSRSNTLCQVKQQSANQTSSCVQGLSQSSFTFQNESADPKLIFLI